MSQVRVRAVVAGRVQGVFYRASTCEQAQARGLVGWVRNLADGRVELEAQGPAAAVDDLIAWCRRGPDAARVDALEVEPVALQDERRFEVRRD